MKSIVCLNGGTSLTSYNRLLTKYLAGNYQAVVTWEEPDLLELPFIDGTGVNDGNEQLRTFLKQVTEADGIVIATPEYNNGTTASIKNALDWCSYQPYPLKNKPTMIIGASVGQLGTVRAQENVRAVLRSRSLAPQLVDTPEVLIGNADCKFDEDGNIMDQRTKKLLTLSMNALLNLM
ncbi:NADPH-dependent FMN reductase [Furfurilactobacillus siliginis]|uniref:NADPH-dependent FMN reductase-like domain-containing protein n=1 Tax=Furfurilactobacillus siliginis TaxID=348151 RepID=A0A0R2L3P7_9LACO|nr:NADPH-dependent FMN reductase [Furfurilactobacillus siliginis]KRN96209.1 hypothetical protein IV55_GL001595 [Furfurilactobacillus siliginis]GEK27866.1 hypothetical protein LSI01_01770 [Furfurilactobacillus siliginis]